MSMPLFTVAFINFTFNYKKDSFDFLMCNIIDDCFKLVQK